MEELFLICAENNPDPGTAEEFYGITATNSAIPNKILDALKQSDPIKKLCSNYQEFVKFDAKIKQLSYMPDKTLWAYINWQRTLIKNQLIFWDIWPTIIGSITLALGKNCSEETILDAVKSRELNSVIIKDQKNEKYYVYLILEKLNKIAEISDYKPEHNPGDRVPSNLINGHYVYLQQVVSTFAFDYSLKLASEIRKKPESSKFQLIIDEKNPETLQQLLTAILIKIVVVDDDIKTFERLLIKNEGKNISEINRALEETIGNFLDLAAKPSFTFKNLACEITSVEKNYPLPLVKFESTERPIWNKEFVKKTVDIIEIFYAKHPANSMCLKILEQTTIDGRENSDYGKVIFIINNLKKLLWYLWQPLLSQEHLFSCIAITKQLVNIKLSHAFIILMNSIFEILEQNEIKVNPIKEPKYSETAVRYMMSIFSICNDLYQTATSKNEEKFIKLKDQLINYFNTKEIPCDTLTKKIDQFWGEAKTPEVSNSAAWQLYYQFTSLYELAVEKIIQDECDKTPGVIFKAFQDYLKQHVASKKSSKKGVNAGKNLLFSLEDMPPIKIMMNQAFTGYGLFDNYNATTYMAHCIMTRGKISFKKFFSKYPPLRKHPLFKIEEKEAEKDEKIQHEKNLNRSRSTPHYFQPKTEPKKELSEKRLSVGSI